MATTFIPRIYLSNTNGLPLIVDNFNLLVVHRVANSAGLQQHVVVREALEGHRAGLSHAIGDDEVFHTKLVNDGFAKLLRAGGSCHQASVQGGQLSLFPPGQSDVVLIASDFVHDSRCVL